MARLCEGLIDELTKSFVNAFNKMSIMTVTDFICTRPESIAQKTAISCEEIYSIRRKLLSKFATLPVNGMHLYRNLADSMIVMATDELLDGGLYTGEIVELVGKSGSGKSQICMYATGYIASTTLHGIIYIDTCGSMQSDRLYNIVKSHTKSEDVSQVLSKIHFLRTHNIVDLISILQAMKEKLDAECTGVYSSLRLLVIDSIASVITPILTVQQNYGHSVMTSLARLLKLLAVQYGISILVTNFVVTGGSAALGLTWSSVPDCRISIKVIKSPTNNNACSERVATLVKSNRQAIHVSTNFFISDDGVVSNWR